MNPPNILFISRKNPPQVGGMEAHSAALQEALNVPFFLIALNKKQSHLIWWLPWALIRALKESRRANIVYLEDALLAPLGYIIKRFTKKPVVVSAHGLDVIYQNRLYQQLIPRTLQKLDHVIAVSHATKIECIKRGIKATNISVIPNGIHPHDRISENPDQILVLGRLVERKGARWFLEHVAPRIPDITINVVGTGEQSKEIDALGNRLPHVTIHGRVSQRKLDALFLSSVVMVMPNIRVEGDMEGFGITALEAGSWGIPVVASPIEGIKDAVTMDESGLFAESLNAEEFEQAIRNCCKWSPEKRRSIKIRTEQHFSWKQISKRYEQVFYTVASGR